MSEKTEQPTPKKLRDARNKGQVFQSKEITSTALLLVSFAYLASSMPAMMERLKEMIVLPARFYNVPFRDALPQVIEGCVLVFLELSLPILGIVTATAIAAGYFQVGALFVFEPMKPDLNKLNPVQGIKKIFSMKNLIELLKSLIKTFFLGLLLYLVIRDAIPGLMHVPYQGADGVMVATSEMFRVIGINTAVVYIILAAADYAFERRQYMKDLMMSKDEVKQEYKEMEGSPEIKGKRKQLHREMVMNDTTQKVRKASVLVTNPTHLAIALQYEAGETPLPLVLAKGEGILAQRMIEIAKEEGIPIMQNVPLAHDLYDQGTVNHYIPSDLIEPIAEVLKFVAELKQP